MYNKLHPLEMYKAMCFDRIGVYNCEAAPQSCRAQGLLSLADGLLQPIPVAEGPQLPTRTRALQPDHTSSYSPK